MSRKNKDESHFKILSRNPENKFQNPENIIKMHVNLTSNNLVATLYLERPIAKAIIIIMKSSTWKVLLQQLISYSHLPCFSAEILRLSV